MGYGIKKLIFLPIFKNTNNSREFNINPDNHAIRCFEINKIDYNYEEGKMYVHVFDSAFPQDQRNEDIIIVKITLEEYNQVVKTLFGNSEIWLSKFGYFQIGKCGMNEFFRDYKELNSSIPFSVIGSK